MMHADNHHRVKLSPGAIGLCLAVAAALWAAGGWMIGSGSPIDWQSSTIAAVGMLFAGLAALQVMVLMTNAGHGLAGVMAAMLVRLAAAGGLIAWAMTAGKATHGEPLVQMVFLNYFAGLLLETLLATTMIASHSPAAGQLRSADLTETQLRG